MPELLAMQRFSNHNIRAQVVLLPPEAADITQQSPPTGVYQLNNGVSVRRVQKNKCRGPQSDAYLLSGLPLRMLRPFQENWYCRGEGTDGERTSYNMLRSREHIFQLLH
jgi:hypothetical protein